MYRKGLLSLFFGICLLGMSTILAQSPASQVISSSNPKDCSTINDVVDREICMAQVAVDQCDAVLATKSLSNEDQTYWLKIRTSQVEKIKRLQKMEVADRQKMQKQFDLSEQAKKAAPSR